jgi:hypothetical protein
MTFAAGFLCGCIATSVVGLVAIANMRAASRADSICDAILENERSRQSLLSMVERTKTGEVGHEFTHGKRA